MLGKDLLSSFVLHVTFSRISKRDLEGTASRRAGLGRPAFLLGVKPMPGSWRATSRHTVYDYQNRCDSMEFLNLPLLGVAGAPPVGKVRIDKPFIRDPSEAWIPYVLIARLSNSKAFPKNAKVRSLWPLTGESKICLTCPRSPLSVVGTSTLQANTTPMDQQITRSKAGVLKQRILFLDAGGENRVTILGLARAGLITMGLLPTAS